MDINRKKEFIVNILFYGIILGALFVAFRYLLPILVPFIIAFLIAWAMQKPCKILYKRFKINKKVSGLVLLIIFYLVIGGLIVLASLGLISFISDVIRDLPSIFENEIRPFLDNLGLSITTLVHQLPPEIETGLLTILQSLDRALDSLISTLSSWALNFATSMVTAVPSFFISTVLCIISSFFFVVDYDKVTGFAYSKLRGRIKTIFDDLSLFMKNKVVVIIKSYALIMSITFIELTIGFFIIGLDGFVWIALGIAIFDILPVFGTGGIMIPWCLITLIQGDLVRGIELAVIYVIVTIIRNIIEPKIVGGNLGLHPVLTLASMLVGAQFFGVIGLFGCPLLISFLLYANKAHGGLRL